MNDLRREARANLRLAVPIIFTQLGMMAMGLVDTAFVGRVSETDLAAVALGNTLVFAVAMPGIGVFMAIEPLASQAIGAGDPGRAHATYREGLRLAFLLAIPTALLTWASVAILPLLRVDPAVIPGARAYVLSRLPGALPFYVYLAAKTYQQAVQRPRTAVEAVIVANVVHAIVGWLAVFRFHLGGTGAGIATSASATILALYVVLVRRERSPSDGKRIDLETSKKLLVLGFPIGLQLAAEVGVFSLVALLMGRIGGRAAAAHQIAIGLASFSFMGALGIAQATSVRVGTAVGDGAPRGARRAGVVGITLGLVSMSVWAIAFALAPTLLARIFTGERVVIDAAAQLIRIAAVFQLADGAQVVSAGALRGAGDTRWPLIANVIAHWCIGFPLAWLFAFRLGKGAPGLWYGLTCALMAVATALASRFVSLTRRDPKPI